MRVLLSAIGSRGEAQPLVALASEIQAAGHAVRLCLPPDLQQWCEDFDFVPIGPPVRTTAAVPAPRRRRELINGTVATQFATLAEAAKDCDALLGFGAMQVAAHSVAEALRLRYAFAAYSPNTLPSAHHAPAPLTGSSLTGNNFERWTQDAERWNDLWAAPLNHHRAAAGLDPVADVRTHMLTATPWLAADPVLAPWPGDEPVVQTGAWLHSDGRPLSAELQEFLATGEPPVYFGLGSMRLPGADLSDVVVEAARAVGRRVILSRGWAGLDSADPDCLVIGETNLRELFRHVAAAVHHGGSGTTTIAARAGAPQVIVPQFYDQHYWADRVALLGIGVGHAPGMPTIDSLSAALEEALCPAVRETASALAPRVAENGTQVAARLLTS